MRRALAVLACLPALLLAADLTPRPASGWAGFEPGTWIRVKRTMLQEKRTPRVTIWTQRLEKVGKRMLTLETVAKNALGIEQTSKTTVPRKGEAGAGETEKVERLEGAPVFAAGKKLACLRRRTTVTGKAGRRVITKWIATDPKVLAKRTEIRYDAAGKAVFRSSWLLAGMGVKRHAAGREVDCVRYKVRTREGETEQTAEILASRDVPGFTVREEGRIRLGGETLTYRVELLDVGTK